MPDLAPENVQDYPRPPALEPVRQQLRIVLNGKIAAETTRAFRVLETHHAPTYYIPPEDVTAALTPLPGTTFCEWKGRAAYFDVQIDGKMAPRAAWSYAAPTRDFTALAGYLSFYASAMDACFVGEDRVIAQPGDFYGGWVTANLQGRIKGAPGTEHW
ncbi:DUF427 domain-containing protein [Jannaschia donghaensis]|uniref:DUF427 domain-containing protein n=1 Tax=Jannaschia donghaensis TaxID=420998 RepID=A0A0M6YMW5_9RHOB|nr:DUF427 domain-containing protein [Jannaschia donghaensis]CTQ51280.1 hypothetical protein JDO7802_03319 [Jannaschia donghaensis]